MSIFSAPFQLQSIQIPPLLSQPLTCPPLQKHVLWEVHPLHPDVKWGSRITMPRMNLLFILTSEEQKALSLIEGK